MESLPELPDGDWLLGVVVKARADWVGDPKLLDEVLLVAILSALSHWAFREGSGVVSEYDLKPFMRPARAILSEMDADEG